MLSHRLLGVPTRNSVLRQLYYCCAAVPAATSSSQYRHIIQISRSLSTAPPSSSSSPSSSSPPAAGGIADASTNKPFNPHSDANRLAQLDLSQFGPEANATQIAQKILDEEAEREKYRKDTRKQWILGQLTVLGVLGAGAYYEGYSWVNPFKPYDKEKEQTKPQPRIRTSVASASTVDAQVRTPTSLTDVLTNPLGSLASLMPKRKRDMTPEEREKSWQTNLERNAQQQAHMMKLEANKHGRTLEEHQKIVEKAARGI